MAIDSRIQALTILRENLKGIAIDLLAVVLSPITAQIDIDALESEIGALQGEVNNLQSLIEIREALIDVRQHERKIRGETGPELVAPGERGRE